MSQHNFAISPQDLTHNDCRIDADTDQFFHSIDTEAMAPGHTSPSESSQVEDQEADMCLSRDQNGPVTLAPGMAQMASQPLSSNKRLSGRALDPQNDPLYHIGAELRKKRDELAAAENTVSKLLAEIKLLEASAKRRGQHFEGISLEDSSKQKSSHKRGNDEILHSAKRLKERATALNFDSEISKRHNAKGEGRGEETLCLTGGHFSTAKDPLPHTISTAEGRTHHYFNQNNNATASDYAAIPAISTSSAPKPCLAEAVQNLGQSLSRPFNDNQPSVVLHAERSSVVQSLSMQTQWSELLDESTNRLSSDPGYASLDIGLFSCRASSIEPLEQSIAWVA